MLPCQHTILQLKLTVTWLKNGNKADGDPVLIHTFELF